MVGVERTLHESTYEESKCRPEHPPKKPASHTPSSLLAQGSSPVARGCASLP